jgi:2-(1,2-epoxy-1,2-dihydrophenyl)acetyl-CoA isomerase
MIEAGNYCGFELRFEDPGIAVVQFNEPERLNGMTPMFKRDLVETLFQFQMEDSVRVVVFTGSGRAFSAGDDISGHEVSSSSQLVPPIFRGHHDPLGTYNGLKFLSQPLNSTVRNLDKLTISAINGVAIQTGFSLALASDFRLAAESARMGSATLRFGLLPDEGGQFLLVQLLGVAGAMDFLMRKRIVEAKEAARLGLVHEVVPDDQLMDRTLELARELANGPQVAMRLLKRSIYNAAEMPWAQSFDEIASKTPMADHHPDAKEGIKAFREKRAPKFNEGLGE